MSFMKPEVFHGAYYSVETSAGTEVVPQEVCGNPGTNLDLRDYLEGYPDEPGEKPEIRNGWLGRMSAPGCLDCTDWAVYATEQQARDALAEMYGDEE